ncbi:MAG TPA: FtsX-like permease family protein [Actinomycetota bacterium]|nr:FtsX-like permease family protein [Actinomycetota bacterium]
MSALRLALRGLRARAGLSVALLAVTTFAVGVGAAGAIYLRAAGESLLAQNLSTATSHTAGLHVSQVVADGRELRSLTESVRAAGPAVPALAAPVTGLETRTPIPLLAEGGRPGSAYLAGRDGLCAHLVVEAGRCPLARPLGVPAEAALSRRAADWLGLGLGDRFRAEGFAAGTVVRDLVVAAVYTPTPRDQYWFGAQRAWFPPPPTGNELPPLDAVFLANADLVPVIDNGTLDIRARFDHFIQPDRMRLDDTAAVPTALGRLAELLRVNNPNATVLTGLADLVAKAEADRQALTVPVLLADVQLACLALLILVVVAAMAAEARAGEVALAKVRGATTGQAFGLAVLELAVVAALALPAGLAVGWLGGYLLARSQLEAGIPVAVTPAAVVVALAATVVALAAASLASLGAVRRRVLDQWRRGRSDRAGRRAVLLDAVLLLVAVASLANLRASGTRQAGGGYDLLATLAPGLAVLAAALVVGRSLPLVAGWLVRLTARSTGVAAWVGARQVARRGGPALRVVIALAAAFGLVAFAVTVRQDMARNRHDRAATQVGAAEQLRVGVPRGALGPELVAEADPSGEAAMAVVRYPAILRDAPAVRATLVGVQPDRYQGVGFWRDDFSERSLERTLAALASSPVPPLDLGRADQLEVDVGAGAVRSDGPVRLVALVEGARRAARVDLGRLEAGGVRPLRGRLDPAGGPWRLRRLWVQREAGVTSAVSASLTFDSVRAGQGGSWRLVEGFDDPARWYSLNDNAYEPGDTLTAAAVVDGAALNVAVDAPDSGVTVGIGHASVPEALPAVVTPAFLQAVSAKVGRVVRVRGPMPGDLLLQVTGVARVLPGAIGSSAAAFVDTDWLLVHAQRNPVDRPAVDEVWTVGGDRGRAVAERLAAGGIRVESRAVAADLEADLAQQAPSLALLLLLVGAAAGAALATGGVMLHLYLTGRRRAFELAVLEVFGARRRDLWGPVAVEQGSLVGYGVLCGGLVGLVVALVALPAIPQFVDRPSVPPPIYSPDWGALGLAVLLVGLGLAAVVAALVHQARPALLREEEL